MSASRSSAPQNPSLLQGRKAKASPSSPNRSSSSLAPAASPAPAGRRGRKPCHHEAPPTRTSSNISACLQFRCGTCRSSGSPLSTASNPASRSIDFTDLFKEDDVIDVSGNSIGKGFQLPSGSGSSKPYVIVSARAGYQLLLEELNAQLIDIRPLKDARDAITPDLKEAKKKVAAMLYNGEDKNGFMKKLTLRFKDLENTCRYF
ncbi:rhodanese-like domain-containing protein 4A, chloroplastic [Miscanthus floridulus]|uniref:rhodanese-like domain-containing protein 4A, chloroplastic n=1 Tax=Miscanthus floridulus TaxID=154761 RepID=UPI00345AB506